MHMKTNKITNMYWYNQCNKIVKKLKQLAAKRFEKKFVYINFQKIVKNVL